MHFQHGEQKEWVFLAVHRAAGQRRLGIGPTHLRGVGPHGAEHVRVNGRAHHTDFHALQIGRRLDGALGVGEFTETVFTPSQGHHTRLVQGLENLLAHAALRQRVDGGVVGHQEGQREQVQFLDLR